MEGLSNRLITARWKKEKKQVRVAGGEGMKWKEIEWNGEESEAGRAIRGEEE